MVTDVGRRARARRQAISLVVKMSTPHMGHGRMSTARAPDTAKRGASAAELNGGPAAKRQTSSAISMTGLQRELQMEVDRRCRLEESVEQLRLELQLMGRLLAAAREQFVACGAPPATPGVALWTAPKPSAWAMRQNRSKYSLRHSVEGC